MGAHDMGDHTVFTKGDNETPEPSINWGYNCLTGGIHHGRPEAIWNLPLGYVAAIYGRDVLKQLVVSRIFRDAMVFVTNSPFVQKGTDATYTYTQEWADLIKETAEEQFLTFLIDKLAELDTYYTSVSWQRDAQEIGELAEKDILNPNYKPLHSHDSVNMLCRILGAACDSEALRIIKER